VRPITSWRAFRRRGRPAGAAAGAARGLDAGTPEDLAELDARLAAVLADLGHEHDVHVAIRLQPLVDRRVPARAVEAVPELNSARIRFADGTAVLVQGSAPGDVGVLACWIRGRSVLPRACATTNEGTHLIFASPSRPRELCVRVTGVDQPT
jgi:hypothetical protein